MSSHTLVITIPGFARDESDTTCITHAQWFVRTVNELFPQLRLIIIPLEYPHRSQSYRWHNNVVMPQNGRRFRSLLAPLKWIKLYNTLHKIKRTQRLMGVLSFWCDTNAMIAHHFAKRNGTRHYCWIQGRDAQPNNRALRYFTPAGNELIALSDLLRQTFYSNHGIRPFKVVTAGISRQELRVLKSQPRDIDILGCGSLIPLKQFDVFIKIVGCLHKQFPSLKVVICGEGPERKKLETLVRAQRLEQAVAFTGTIDHEAVKQLMCRSKILLHTSSYEGYPRVCLEALAAGCQVVSFIRPQHQPIDNWFTDSEPETVVRKITAILTSNATSYTPVVPHSMESTVTEMLALYDYSE